MGNLCSFVDKRSILHLFAKYKVTKVTVVSMETGT